MNATHVHLLVNHLTVMGAFLGIIVLLFAIITNTVNTYYAAYTVLIISVIGCIIAYTTGESAEETVEGIVGVAESAIEPHEDSALRTIVSFSLLGLITLTSFVVSRFKVSLQRTMGFIVLAASLISFSLAARTAWLGGKIRHTEISRQTDSKQASPEEAGDD
jgi:hypothetical protein